MPASALERLILPARVADYTPAYLDELTASGDLLWSGGGAIGEHDGWISLAFADTAPLLLPPPADVGGPVHAAILTALAGGQALFLRTLAERVNDILASTPPAPSADQLMLDAPTLGRPPAADTAASKRTGGRGNLGRPARGQAAEPPAPNGLPATAPPAISPTTPASAAPARPGAVTHAGDWSCGRWRRRSCGWWRCR